MHLLKYEKLYDGLIEEEARRKEAIRLQQAREAAEAALKLKSLRACKAC